MTKSSSIHYRIKFMIDRILAAIVFILLLPLIATIAALVVLESGRPVFFTQDRLGQNGTIFRIWKFRSMVQNADHFLNSSGEANCNRLTRVGVFLRRTSLDEIPQLINIIRGEMSFVGPRAALPDHIFRYTSEQKKRLAFKPGVTGLAQIKGRNTLKWSRRIRYDNWYIRNYSLCLDAWILARTVRVVALGEGVVIDRNASSVDDLAPLDKS